MSFVVVNEICRQRGIDFNKNICGTKHLYAIGSILLGFHDAVIWGSGFGYKKEKGIKTFLQGCVHKLYHKTDVRAIRGPESRRILQYMGIKCPEIYGDPAALMPLIYKPDKISAQHEYVIIPHFSRYEYYKSRYENVVSTFCCDYKSFIDVVLHSKLVISSSLHGIILAEAYGVPTVMLSDTPSNDITKYRDWYLSTGRDSFPLAKSVENALLIGGTPVDYRYIEKIQKNLLDSFPEDLWK